MFQCHLFVSPYFRYLMRSLENHTVPFTSCEWTRARDLYNSNELESLMECLNIVSMWMSRMGRHTPVFITCTELVVRLTIEEIKLQMNPSVHGRENVKLLHGICCVRFVNFVNELGQKDGPTLRMQDSVAKFGIPGWVVSVRHDVAHQHYPSLGTLRRFHSFARKWLWHNVWEKPLDVSILRAGLDSNTIDEESKKAEEEKEERLMNIIRDFIKWRQSNPRKQYTPDVIRAMKEMKKIVTSLELEPHDFLKVMLRDSFLILTKEQLKDSSIQEDTIVSGTLQEYWGPVVLLIMYYQLASEFLVTILNRLAERNISELSKKQLVEWAGLVIGNYADPDNTVLAVTEWNRILRSMIAVPDCFTSEDVSKVMAKIPNMTRKRRKQVARIMDITVQGDLETVDDSLSVKTIEDLQRLIKKDAVVKAKTSGDWEICDEDDWGGLPIGMTPFQTYESISLIIDDDYPLNRTNYSMDDLTLMDETGETIVET